MKLTALQNAQLKAIFISAYINNKTLEQLKQHADKVNVGISDDDVIHFYTKFLCHVATLEIDKIKCNIDKDLDR